LPLPPLEEQRAIARVLRTIQRAKEATEKVIAATRELKKSLMRHLLTYGLVSIRDVGKAAVRQSQIGQMPAHWKLLKVGQIADVKGGKRLPKGHKFSPIPTSRPYLRIVDFKSGSVASKDIRFLREEDHEATKRYIIRSSDVYISIAGTIGLVGTVPSDLDGAHLTENAARLIIRDPEQVDRDYLAAFLGGTAAQTEITKRTTKTSQPKLALARIADLPIALPPICDQRAIAAMLAAVDAKLRREERRSDALSNLFESVLRELTSGLRRVGAADTGVEATASNGARG
jgi:type I restriction enzyme S subunit